MQRRPSTTNERVLASVRTRRRALPSSREVSHCATIRSALVGRTTWSPVPWISTTGAISPVAPRGAVPRAAIADSARKDWVAER